MQKGTCKLCGKNKELIRKSHIIPTFMYQTLYDGDNRLYLQPFTGPANNGKLVQTGIFDKNILCAECDNRRIGQWERYAAGILFGQPPTMVPQMQGQRNPDGSHSIVLSKIVYKKFKLFLLSILWRAHVSQNKFFEKVQVFSNEPVLRQMLLSENAGSEEYFKIVMLAIKDRSGELIRLLPAPETHWLGKGSFVTFFISGFVYFIDLDPGSDFALFEKFYLRSNGDLEIPIVAGKTANELLKGFGLGPKVADYFTDPHEPFPAP